MMILAANFAVPEFLFSLLIILVFAKIFAEIFERIGQPAVVGEILAGVVIGPSVLHLVAPNEIISSLAKLESFFCYLRLVWKRNRKQF